MSSIPSTSGRVHFEFVYLLFLESHRETDLFFPASGVHLMESNTQYHYRHTVFSSQLKSKVGHILVKTVVLRINLNIDDAPVSSRSHTHPSHSQTSRLLTSASSLSLGVFQSPLSSFRVSWRVFHIDWTILQEMHICSQYSTSLSTDLSWKHRMYLTSTSIIYLSSPLFIFWNPWKIVSVISSSHLFWNDGRMSPLTAVMLMFVFVIGLGSPVPFQTFVLNR